MTAPNFRPNTLFVADNLPVLRGMDSATVDLIYLDPPFNSLRMYQSSLATEKEQPAFEDTWRWDDQDQRWLGEIDRRNPALAALVHAAKLAQGEGTAAYLVFMGVRLLELHRALKPTGSIYLHCDDTANSYLRASLDAVFGAKNFRNEIVWRRISGGGNDAAQYGRNSDHLLFYSKGNTCTFDPPRLPSGVNDSWYRNNADDGLGPYVKRPLLGSGETKGDSGQPWRGVTPKGHWIVPNLLTARYEREQGRKLTGTVRVRLEALAKAGYVDFSKNGNPSWRRYLSEANPPRADSIWDDIRPIGRKAKERTGWSTQKPLALLQRIVKASSNPGDLVLDPFAGCATCCVAAAIEGRQWVGIELCEAGSDIVQVRLAEAAMGELGAISAKAHICRRPPRRTDLNGDEPRKGTRLYKTRENIDYLYGRQRGDCAGCKLHFRVQNLTVDHVHPRSQGGPDAVDNLQLLCGSCNSIKGDRDMPYLIKRLAEIEAERQARLDF